VKRLETKIIMY